MYFSSFIFLNFEFTFFIPLTPFFSPGEEREKEDLATASERLFRSLEKLKRLNALRLDGIRFLRSYSLLWFNATRLGRIFRSV
jgi:hypothetical protein